MPPASRHRVDTGQRAAPGGPGRGAGDLVRRHRAWFSVAVVVLVLVVGALVAVPVLDTAARTRVAAGLAERVQAELGLAEPPDVTIAGDDFLWQAVRGRYDGTTLSTPGLRYDGVSLGTTRVRLQDVRVPLRVLLGGSGTVTVASGEASTVIGWEELDARASAAVGTDVELSRGGGSLVAETSVARIPLVVALTPSVEGERITLSPTAVEVAGRELPVGGARDLADALGLGEASEALLGGVSFGLDEVPEQLSVQRAAVARDGLRVSGTLAPIETPVER